MAARNKSQMGSNHEPVKRSRGAQPGNLNALKHGFYSRRFSELELSDLEAALDDGLGSEIAALRVMIRRVIEKFDSNQDDLVLDEAAHLLGSVGSAMSRLASLLRTDQVISGKSNQVMDAISEAISEFTKDLTHG